MSANRDNNLESGWVGGFNIGATSITDVGDSMGISSLLTSADDVRFWAGGTYEARASAVFNVTRAGVLSATGATISGTLTATAGAIGGFSIGSDYVRDSANSFGLASTVTGGDDVRFWAGATFANRATAPFRVTEAGVLTSASGTIGGFTIGSTTLSASGGTEPITLDSSGPISVGTNSASNYYVKITSGYNGSGGSFVSRYDTKKVLVLDTHPTSPGVGEISLYDASENRNVFISGGGYISLIYVIHAVTTVGALPAAGTSAGYRAIVSDATATLTAGIGAVVTGGGANYSPVWCDGTNWRQG